MKDNFDDYIKKNFYNEKSIHYGEPINKTDAPVSEYAAFAYTTALNDLLSDSENKKFLGDTTVVYWAEKIVWNVRIV